MKGKADPSLRRNDEEVKVFLTVRSDDRGGKLLVTS
jgi:hypothetical protein